ncbi:hypothetical protein [Modestobacter sp. SYSU DS0875]
MLIPPEGWSALLAAGFTVRPLSASEVELSSGDGGTDRVVAVVQRRSSPLLPSHVHHAVVGAGRDSALLLVVPGASPAALDAAEAAGISVLVADERRREPVRGRILMPTRTVEIAAQAPRTGPTAAPTRPGKRPWGALTTVRQLLSGGVASQVELATRAAVSQGRVSQTLAGLVDAKLVRRMTVNGRPRWAVADWDGLADWWLGRYPGPDGLTTYWYGFSDVPEQARLVAAALRRADVPVAVSGDVAADLLAPWRHPTRAVVYAEVGGHPAVDLTTVGLTPSGPDEATLELIVPADPGVWATGGGLTSHGGLPLADGMQVLWDLQRAPGSDTDQAVAALRPVLRARATEPEAAQQ